MAFYRRHGRLLAIGFSILLAHGLIWHRLWRETCLPVPVDTSRYSRLLLISPIRRVPAVAPVKTPAAIAKRISPIPRAPSDKLPETNPLTIAETEAVIAQDIGLPREADPFHSQPIDIDGLVKQAGKIDRASRPTGTRLAEGYSRDSIVATLNRGFNEARMAVPPKWYEAARIELFSAPNDTRPVYQVTTAFGTYCVFYPDKNRGQSGAANFGQPKVAGCPKRF